MIIRKFVTALRNQDWFVVCVEFVIVVLGILVGLQVNDWNEQRKLDAHSDAFILEIQSDIALAIDTSRRLLERYESDYEAGARFLERLLSDEGISALDETDLQAIARITYYTIPNIRQGSMALALAPEGATLVRSRDARAALVEFQRNIERSDIVADRILGRLERIEPVLNRYRAMHVGQEGDVRFAVRYDLEAMNESQEFKFAFQNALMVHFNAVMFTRFTVEALEELQAELQIGDKYVLQLAQGNVN